MTTTSNGFSRTAVEAAEANGSQAGKVFLITGAYSGIGAETIKALLKVKGQVILAGRNDETMKQFLETLIQEGYDEALIDAEGPACDLANLETVKAFAAYVKQRYTKLDVVIFNAGIMMTPVGATTQGQELQVGTNVVGHFLLAQSLLNITSRQVWVSSKAHEMYGGKRFDFAWFQGFQMPKEGETSSYDTQLAYQQSKLGDILLAKEFAKRHENLETVALHPGVATDTNLTRHMSAFSRVGVNMLGMVGIVSKKTVEQGAATSVTCATSETIKNGGYYEDCAPVQREAGNATNQEDAIRLYNLCNELTKEFQ